MVEGSRYHLYHNGYDMGLRRWQRHSYATGLHLQQLCPQSASMDNINFSFNFKLCIIIFGQEGGESSHVIVQF